MMRKKTRQRLLGEISDWYHRGTIDESLKETLSGRYEKSGWFLAGLLKWLGLFAVLCLSLGILALVGMETESVVISGLLLGFFSAGSIVLGIRLATDPKQKHSFTGAALTTVGIVGVFGTMALLVIQGQPDNLETTVPILMLLTSVVGMGVAYYGRLRWPLMVSLLFIFHAAGSYHQYWGHGTYVFNIQEPTNMLVLAIASILLGLYHENVLEEKQLQRWKSFGHYYIVLGLVYFNASLWLLTVPHSSTGTVLAFFAGTVAEIVAGSMLNDNRFLGFGIVFFGINLFTRYFEHFWNQLELSLFLILGGALAVGLGAVLEYIHRATNGEGTKSSE